MAWLAEIDAADAEGEPISNRKLCVGGVSFVWVPESHDAIKAENHEGDGGCVASACRGCGVRLAIAGAGTTRSARQTDTAGELLARGRSSRRYVSGLRAVSRFAEHGLATQNGRGLEANRGRNDLARGAFDGC